MGRKELERREIIEEFLEFSRRFPRQFKGEMMDSGRRICELFEEYM